MAQNKKKDFSDDYKTHSDSIKSGQLGSFFIYHGDERYLLDHCLRELRLRLCPTGLDGFNYKRFEGRNINIDELADAIGALPVFADRTLIEIHDFDIFKYEDKQRLAEMLSDLPEYVCIVVIYDTVPFKPDGRQKQDKEILKCAQVIEFAVQPQNMLVNWITRHFASGGKSISRSDAEYLLLITGGYMSALQGEIGKISAYTEDERVTRADIDAVVIPVLDAVVYKLTDALVRREYAAAMRVLDELLRMREAPQMLMFSISLKMRQLLAARICIESNSGIKTLIGICGIRHEFQAKLLIDTARKTSLAGCCDAVLLCADTAFALNSAPEPEARLTELIARLADAV